VLAAAALACYPATTRPDLQPLAEAPRIEVELFVPEATRALAVALDADSIPVRRTEPRDGWLESEWFDMTTLRPVTGRPLGIQTVKVRAFVDPGQPNHSVIFVETVYRLVADPSRPDRDLEQQVPTGHPVAVRVLRAIDRVVAEYGEANP
jgi:hypothetical protein